MDVGADQQPSAGEVLVLTMGGGFIVKGTMQELAAKLSQGDWTDCELAESGDHIMIRSGHVVALRAGTHSRKGSIGFVHRG